VPHLHGGQSVTGRLWDLLCVLRASLKLDTDRCHFQMRVDTLDNGRCKTVKLWAPIGLGDTAEPVLTIMLEGED